MSLEYKPTERLHEFSMKLKTKIEKGGEDRMAALRVAAAQAVPEAQTVAAADLLCSYAEVAAAGKPKVLCSYCHRQGHSAYKCYKKRRDKRQGIATGGQASPHYKPHKDLPHTRESAASRQTPGTVRSDADKSTNAYCLIHECWGHSTEDCHRVVKLKAAMKQERNFGGRQSGEVARAARNKPG